MDKFYTVEFFLKEKSNGRTLTGVSELINAFKALYSGVYYILSNENEVDCSNVENSINIDSFSSEQEHFILRVKTLDDDITHAFMRRNLHFISLCMDKVKKEEFETLCHGSIRYLFKTLFQTIIKLGVSKVEISYIKAKYILTEERILDFIRGKDNYSGSRMSSEIQDGMRYLDSIFSQIREHLNYASTKSQFYENPQLIFRGINRFYPGTEINCKLIKDRIKQTPKEHLDLEEELLYVKKDLIRSSLSVRLRDISSGLTKNDAYIRSHYVNALEDLIQKAKHMYPGKYTDCMTDLDILADLQHNGGATCLVDFSKNILTSIWFACSSERDSNGFLYCYNVMEDMIKNDALTNIRPEDEKKQIAELLAQTYRETNVCSNVETRFCLWEPSKKNNRIFRQDSVFIFGIEKFEVEKHAIKVIGIKSEWKLPILSALKAIYNITGATVYNDYVGFANNANKNRPYRKMADGAYTRGYMNMIKGNYNSAIEFFKLSEIEMCRENDQDQMKRLELHFSLGVCYKGLARQNKEIHYYENALLEYGQVILIAKNLVECQHIINADYYRHKAIRAYNARIALMYDISRYEQAIKECEDIEYDINKGWLQSYKEGNGILTSKYCEISVLELQALVLLSIKEQSRIHDVIERYNIPSLIKEIRKFPRYKKRLDFMGLLKEFYICLAYILTKHDRSTIESKQLIDSITTQWRLRIKFDSKRKLGDYILWNFSDLKKIIDSISKDSPFFEKKEILQDLTADAISLRDSFQMYGWWSKKNI